MLGARGCDLPVWRVWEGGKAVTQHVPREGRLLQGALGLFLQGSIRARLCPGAESHCCFTARPEHRGLGASCSFLHGGTGQPQGRGSLHAQKPRGPAAPSPVPAEGLSGARLAGFSLPSWKEISWSIRGRGKLRQCYCHCGSAFGQTGVTAGGEKSPCLIPFKRFPLCFPASSPGWDRGMASGPRAGAACL